MPINPWSLMNQSLVEDPEDEELMRLGLGAVIDKKRREAEAVTRLNPLPGSFLDRRPTGLDPSRAELAPQKLPQPAPARATRPGDKNVEEVSGNQTRKVSESSVVVPTDEQWGDMYARAEASPDIQEAKRGIGDMEALIQFAAKRGPNLDLTPLMQLTDAWSGSKLAQGYKAPADPTKELLGYADEMQKRRGDLAKLTNERIKAQKFGTVMDSIQNALVQKATGTSAVPVPKTGKPYDPNMDVQRLQKRMEPLEGFRAGFEFLNKTVKEETGKDVFEWSKEKKVDIPGIGPLKGSLFKMGALSDKGRKIRQAYEDQQDALLRAKSGAQINEAEFQRLKRALGDGNFSHSTDFVNAMVRFHTTLSDVMRQREAGFNAHPEVKKLYNQGGGVTSEQFRGLPNSSGPSEKDQKKKDLDAKIKAIEDQLKGQ